MKYLRWAFPVMGALLVWGGLAVNLPAGNYVWVVYDLALGAWCFVLPFVLFV